MSNVKATYQCIREELVSLSVELEERTKVCELLRKRLDDERYSARNIDEDLKKVLDCQLRDLVHTHKDEMGKLMKEATELMGKKKDLMERCQELVGNVADTESELGSTIQRIREEGIAALDKDKKLFKTGYEDRKAKVLSEKMSAIKAETRRAMEPEFQRLRRHHDSALNDLLIKLSQEEKELRDTYDKLLRDRMVDEERAWKTSSQIRARETLDNASYELDKMEAAHKDDMTKLSRELKSALEKHKTSLSDQIENEKRRLKTAISRVKDENESQTTELRNAHRQSIEQLHEDHEEAVQRLRLRDESARAAADRQHETEMNAASSVMSKRKDKSNTNSDEVNSNIERDARVQAEIRRLQTETIKFEKSMKSKIENEKRSIEEAAERELSTAEKNYARTQSEISELTVQKEALLAAIQKSTNERIGFQELRLDAESEITLLDSEIREQEEENMLKMEQLAKERKDELNAVVAAVERSHQKFLSVQKLLFEKERAHQEEISEAERKFEKCLEDMDRNVRTDVDKFEREIEILRDAVHTEKIKQEKLNKILKSYSSSKN